MQHISEIHSSEIVINCDWPCLLLLLLVVGGRQTADAVEVG